MSTDSALDEGIIWAGVGGRPGRAWLWFISVSRASTSTRWDLCSIPIWLKLWREETAQLRNHTRALSSLKTILSSFLYVVLGRGYNFILHVAIRLSQHICWKRLFFPLWIILAAMSKLNWCKCENLSLNSILFHWSIYVYLYASTTVLITVALSLVLKSGGVSPPT